MSHVCVVTLNNAWDYRPNSPALTVSHDTLSRFTRVLTDQTSPLDLTTTHMSL